MSYTLYKDVKVLSIEKETVERMRRPKEIADPSFRRDNYQVSVARFSKVDYSLTISDFKNDIAVGQQVSIAVDDKNQVIALINHSTGVQRSLKSEGLNFSEIASTFVYLLIPGLLGFFIARKAFSTVKYHDLGWAVIAIAGGFIIFIIKGVAGQYTVSTRALKELSNS